jgi:hypothetical protein
VGLIDVHQMRRPGLSVIVAVLLLLVGCGRAPTSAGYSSGSRTTSPPTSLTTLSPNSSTACLGQRPSARSGASIAYMSDLSQAVLFGGWSKAARGYLNDTWTLQAGCWTLNQVSSAPSPRTAMAMTYYPLKKVAVAFGGRTDPSLPVFSSETWLWDGHRWTQGTSGPSLDFSWAAFDENLQQVLLYGDGPNGLGQTWTWDGTHWHQASGQSPPARSGAGMAFDPASHRMLLFGGLDNQTMTLLNDTWAWSGSAWSKLTPVHSPSPRQAFAMASFSAHNEVVLVGGNGRGEFVSDAWLWNGSDWSQTSGIGARIDSAAVDIGSAFLLFGGADPTQERNDVQLWNGSVWTTG